MNARFAPPLVCSCCSDKATALRSACRVPVIITDPRVRAVIAQVMLATGIRSEHIFSRLRTQRVATARALIATRLRLELHHSLPAIGEFLGRDHSSVIAMIRKTRRIVEDRGAP